jgi:hypothetical protein
MTPGRRFTEQINKRKVPLEKSGGIFCANKWEKIESVQENWKNCGKISLKKLEKL